VNPDKISITSSSRGVDEGVVQRLMFTTVPTSIAFLSREQLDNDCLDGLSKLIRKCRRLRTLSRCTSPANSRAERGRPHLREQCALLLKLAFDLRGLDHPE
jgi:hypothetical protein